MPNSITRRALIVTGLATAGGAALAQSVTRDIGSLKPGEYTWHPERSPSGPVAIIVSIPEQRVHVYRNGIRIAASTCSTGKPGHATPTGVFTILQKDKHHRSSTYNNAPMPNMNRLTWDGVALHAGNLPGFPASHGCVRLPLAFSERLFGVTHVGTPVIVAGASSDPVEVVHPGLLLAGGAETEILQATSKLKKPPADAPATAVLVSAADRKAVLMENGVKIAEGSMTMPATQVLGEHVFVLAENTARDGYIWHGVNYAGEDGKPVEAPEGSILKHLGSDAAFRAMVHSRLFPGVLLVTTALPLSPDRQSGRDFVIMTA